MRCKPGMPVMVIRSACNNEGRVGTVDRWVPAGTRVDKDYVTSVSGWVVAGTFNARRLMTGRLDVVPFGVFPDASLKPLDGGDGVDEVLRYAGHPQSQSHREKAGA
jgi:hypothetical protein